MARIELDQTPITKQDTSRKFLILNSPVNLSDQAEQMSAVNAIINEGAECVMQVLPGFTFRLIALPGATKKWSEIVALYRGDIKPVVVKNDSHGKNIVARNFVTMTFEMDDSHPDYPTYDQVMVLLDQIYNQEQV